MATHEGPLSQRLIIYNAGRKHGAVYGTAYTEQQVAQVKHNCFKRHGAGCYARVVLGADHYAREQDA